MVRLANCSSAVACESAKRTDKAGATRPDPRVEAHAQGVEKTRRDLACRSCKRRCGPCLAVLYHVPAPPPFGAQQAVSPVAVPAAGSSAHPIQLPVGLLRRVVGAHPLLATPQRAAARMTRRNPQRMHLRWRRETAPRLLLLARPPLQRHPSTQKLRPLHDRRLATPSSKRSSRGTRSFLS